MDFTNIKNYHLSRLKKAIESKEVDFQILPLLEVINSLENYVTSSSCAGRIVLMKIPKSGKKNEAEFLFKSHDPVNYKDVWNALVNSIKYISESIWFKQEPFIVHVISKDLDSAEKMLAAAHKAGLKHSGIIALRNKIVIEIQSTERIETIVAKDEKILINEDYMQVLIEEANKKLKKTREKMNKLIDMIKKDLG